jgi:hypothetical protein
MLKASCDAHRLSCLCIYRLYFETGFSQIRYDPYTNIFMDYGQYINLIIETMYS